MASCAANLGNLLSPWPTGLPSLTKLMQLAGSKSSQNEIAVVVHRFGNQTWTAAGITISNNELNLHQKGLPDLVDLCLPGRIAAEHQRWPRFHAAASLPECAE